MTARRTLSATALAAAAAIAALALAACDVKPGATGTPATAPAAPATRHTTVLATADNPCTAQYVSADGTGIETAHGKVTGTLALNCGGEQPSDLVLSVELFYRPNSSVGTTNPGSASYSKAATSYTATDLHCQSGLYYLGVFYSGTLDGRYFQDAQPDVGPTETLTAADCKDGAR